MKYFLLSLTALFVSISCLSAQELQCKVTVNAPSVQLTDPKVFQSMKTTIEEFMNNTKWTDDEWLQEEKIPVSIIINISKDKDQMFFEGEFSIQTTRPVYGSSYSTPLINHLDKDFSIEYQQFQPLIYTRNSTNTGLVSILAFYAYMVLGYDYDSFEPNGGSPYFKTAWEIVLTMNNRSGWNADKSLRNRYWMCENILSNRSTDFRKAIYEYHRTGLDVAGNNVEEAKTQILEALEDVQKTNQAYFQSMMVQMFCQAKSNEIIEIFKQASPAQKTRVLALMAKLDPSNANKYRQQIGS